MGLLPFEEWVGEDNSHPVAQAFVKVFDLEPLELELEDLVVESLVAGRKCPMKLANSDCEVTAMAAQHVAASELEAVVAVEGRASAWAPELVEPLKPAD